MAGRGKKLSDAYVELRADDSKLSGDTKVKARKVGKEFGGQLNNALKTLSLDPVDVKADPKSAIAAIETARARLRDMSRDAETVEVRVRTERALTQLERFRKQLGQVDDEPVQVEADVSPARRQVEQLRRQLVALGVDPVDLDADPAAALAAIKRVDEQLEQLSGDAATVHVRVDAESARSSLARLRKQLGDDGDKMGVEVGARFGVSTVRGMFAELGASIKNPPPQVYAGVGLLAAALAPTLGAGIAAGVVGGAAAGGIIGGVTLASRDARVQRAGASLGAFILGDLTDRSSGFVTETLEGIERIRGGWRAIGPDLDRIFASSRFIDPLVDGATRGMQKVIGGVADAVENADPVVIQFGRSMDRLGDAVGDTFSLLAEDAEEGASALDDLTLAAENLVRVSGGIVHFLAQIKGGLDGFDQLIDKGRYAFEDYILPLDLTADGFKRGSKEAFAYRRMVTGTATDADFATLKLAGMTDAQLGLNTAQQAGVTAAEQLKQQTQLLGEIDTVARGELDKLLTSTGAVTGAMQAQKQMSDLLRSAHEQMFSAVINQTDANEAYEASWDSLSTTVKENADQVGKNKNNLDLHTKAGRSNRDALQDLLGKSTEMYYADIAAGVAIGEATKKHEARIGKIRTEAGQLKLNKTETEKLISTYGRIPPSKTTDLLVDGLDRIGRALTDLYIFQRSLATGRTLAQVRSDLFGGYAGNPRAFKAEGGPIEGVGTGTSDSNVIWASKGEFMQRASAVDYYGVAAMHALNQKRIPKEALEGYATGGLIDRLKGRNWGDRMLYEVDVHRSRIPTREEVSSRVIPNFGPWPSSPSAQRGDSGVWRQVLALVRGSGIPFAFGNAYRPGDAKWHGSGRAVDFMGYNQDRLARFFMGMQSKVLELIHRTDSGDYAVTRGRRTSMPTQLPLHRNHLHVAMDDGGYLMPGWNPPIYNGTGRPEPVTPPNTMDALIDEIRLLREDVRRVGGDVGQELNGAVAGAHQLSRSRVRTL